ncbi:DUF2442 domain-containing protein [Leptolyngbya sp. BC1307]|uniref:DUF2442 domain-containing protein n=1 Tax=Leptolyngbya sp. BC1307 TaxID=2029589 RepID=UPI000EFD7C59|nr:DUF2442 domain-containing protein [Leptolyngbya sp. BC1307]
MTTLTLETEPLAVSISVDHKRLTVDLVDGRSLVIPLEWYPRLLHGSLDERGKWQLLGEGYAIEWPDLDEHIGIEGLIAGRRSRESQRSLDKWLSRRQLSQRSD